MKLALISAGLFLLSYIAVNGGLGPRPMLLIVPVLVAVGAALAARWLMTRNSAGRGESARTGLAEDVPDEPPQRRHGPRAPITPPSRSSSRPPGGAGGKARKLF